MKYAAKSLKDFIVDFRLTNPAGADCFNATINFIVGGKNITMQSEVHIVTSYPGRNGIVYLLSQDIRIEQLPTMFEADRELFEYVPHKNLRIAGLHYKAGSYIVFIHPDKGIVNY